MTRAERILTASRGKRADKLPFFHYWRHSQIGWAERECRNRGMGMNWARPSFVQKIHDVRVSEEQAVSGGHPVLRRMYTTPVGTVYTEERREPGTGQWHGSRSWKDVSPWQTKRLIEGPDDYEAVKFMINHTEYAADYFPVEQAMDWLGDDGIVMDILPHSPMQTLMIDLIGSEGGRFFYHFEDYPELVEDLYRAISKSREPMYEIVAGSPSSAVMCGENIDGFLVNPPLFEKYFMPELEKQAAILHKHDKLMAVHMDGRVANLKDLIAQTTIDIVEALPPPPMGDLPLGEALDLWHDKVIWVGFPGGIYELGPRATQRYTVELLREIGQGERVVITMSPENLVSNENLLAVTSVLEKAELPLTADKIGEIDRSIGSQ